jgi:hypothetical protein
MRLCYTYVIYLNDYFHSRKAFKHGDGVKFLGLVGTSAEPLCVQFSILYKIMSLKNR